MWHVIPLIVMLIKNMSNLRQNLMIKLAQCLIEISLSETLVLIQFHQSTCILLSSTIEYSYSRRGHHSGTSLCFYFIYAGKLYGCTHRKITRQWKSTVKLRRNTRYVGILKRTVYGCSSSVRNFQNFLEC